MDKKFIEQAKAIRREYVKNLNGVLKYEDKINKYKDELTEIEKHLEPNNESLLQKMMEIEKNINAIESIMNPFTKRVKRLEKDADQLFDNIRERHPELSTQDIQNELIPHLKEIKF